MGALIVVCSGLNKVVVENINKFAEIEFEDSWANPLRYAGNIYLTTDTENPLTSIEFTTATKIGDYAFSCTSLTCITIPDSVQTIGEEAFRGCSALTDVYYTGSEEEWDAITIGDNNSNLRGATIHYNYVEE